MQPYSPAAGWVLFSDTSTLIVITHGEKESLYWVGVTHDVTRVKNILFGYASQFTSTRKKLWDDEERDRENKPPRLNLSSSLYMVIFNCISISMNCRMPANKHTQCILLP